MAPRGPLRATVWGCCHLGVPKSKSCTKGIRLQGQRPEVTGSAVHQVVSPSVFPLLALPFPAQPAACPWPLSTHIHTSVLGVQGRGASGLFFGFLFKPIQFDGSWAAALTQEQGKAVPEGEENCGDFLPGWAGGWGQ